MIDPGLAQATAALRSIGRDIPMPASANELIAELAECVAEIHRALRMPPEIRSLVDRLLAEDNPR